MANRRGSSASRSAEATAEHQLRATFDANDALTIGLEEEVLLLDPATHSPIPVGPEVVGAADDPRVKGELPACQIELLTGPHPNAAGAIGELAQARALLSTVCGDDVDVAAAAVHPSVAVVETLNDADRYRHIADTFGEVARRQLVGSLQVHVALGSADRSLAVYNTLRGHLPEIAALAAAAPFYEGRDTGLASVRPLICGQLPRQGVPPAIRSWASYSDELRWGVTSRSLPDPRQWWWELRPHVLHGTLEVRVPDVQITLEATAAVVEVIHALVSWLAARYDDGARPSVPATWRIAENRWNALRNGVHGTLADLDSGIPVPTVQRLHGVFDEIEPHAPAGLDRARALVEASCADALRKAGVDNATRLLTEGFYP